MLSPNSRCISHPRFLQRLSLALPQIRSYCTSNPFDLDPDSAADIADKLSLLSGRHGESVKEVFLSSDGESLQDITRGNLPGPSFDWADFERRFGLDTITDEDVERGWKEMELRRTDSEGPFHVPQTSTTTPDGRWTKSNKFESSDISLEFVDGAVPCQELRDHISEQHAGKLQSSVQSPKAKPRPFENAAADFELGERAQKAPLTRSNRKQRSDPLEQRIFSAADPLQQLPNPKRPGYERRVASIERQMEKIAERILCAPNSEWSMEGGEFERVLLSSNLQNLTIFYNSEESSRGDRWWKKFNAKYAGMLRASMASELRMKYVPRVFFQRETGGMGSKEELDTLFQRIEMERAERVKGKGEMEGQK